MMKCIGMNNCRAIDPTTVTCGYSMIIHSNVRHHKSRSINKAFPIFLMYVEKHEEAWVRG